MDFGTLFRSNVRRVPSQLAVAVGDSRLTYRELDERALRLADGLARLGVGKGDRVGLFLFDGVEWVETYLAATLLGAPPVPINYRYGRRELAHIVADARVRLLVYDARLAPLLDALPERPRLVVCGEPDGEAVPYGDLAGEPRLPAVRIAPDDVHTISYTSGTTGLPKGAIFTHMNTVVNGVFNCAAAWGLRSDDVILVTTPLCHRTGQNRLINALGLGAILVVMPRFEPDAVIDACLAHGVTLTSMVPSMAPRFLEAAARRGFDGGSLRAILFTGEPFPGPLQRAVREAFPRAAVYGFYASTEGGVIASLDPVDQEAHPGSVGRPRPGVEVRVVGPDGNDLPAGEAGELWIRGGEPGTYAVCKGYLGDPPETSAAWVDGWYRSGDVGRYDADGFLYVVGRVKDMIISGGLNIAAREVEEVVGEHPAVSEVAVVGVPDPDYGEAVLAYVVTRPGATCTAEEIVEHCRATMASYKKPRHVRFVSDLPRNAVGKIDKLALRALALEPA